MNFPELTFNDTVLSFTEGITATSAQHLCNIAKEMYAEIENRHANLQFYNENLQAFTGNPILLSRGLTEESLNVLTQDIHNLTVLKSFIAYLKEAITYKESLYEQYQEYSWNSMHSAKFYKENYPSAPIQKSIKDLLKDLPIGERQKYYRLETECAVLGGFVHPTGGLSKARKKLIEKKNTPSYIDNSGSETIVHHFTPSVDLEKVDELFFNLQQDHRHAQAEFNKMKFDLETAEKNKYNEELAQYNAKLVEFNNTMACYQRDFELNQLETLKKIQTLKIVIPDPLKRTYKDLSSK